LDVTIKDKPQGYHHSESHQPGWDEHHFTLPLSQEHSIKLPSPPKPVAAQKEPEKASEPADTPTSIGEPVKPEKPVAIGAPVKPEQPVV
jgi:hypothetical protein